MGARGYDLFWGTMLRTTTHAHRLLDRASGGRLGRHFPGGRQVVWITTLGRRSGQWRRTPLLAVRESDASDAAWVIAGSNAGQAAVPSWVHNLRAHDRGVLEVDGVVHPATFVEVSADDRVRLYGRLERTWSAYGMYQRNAGREIPVFRVLPHLPDLP